MQTTDFDFELPESFIAQNPVVPRDSSKLMVFDSAQNKVFHRHFRDIVEYLSEEDVLVLNRSKVMPARVRFVLNGAEKEVFVLKDLGEGRCEALVRPGRFFKLGRKVEMDEFSFEVLEVKEDGRRVLSFDLEIEELMMKYGEMPLPPYIDKSEAGDDQYQTVFAKDTGSVAAPTAGLHFTERLFESLKKKGVSVEEVLLYVGLGTFLPVSVEDLEKHQMHSEELFLDQDVAERLNSASGNGKRFVAVGTTSVRVLESSFENGTFRPGPGSTDLFIYPGAYDWKVVGALVTNFHLPKSTLIMLVASFLESKGVVDPVAKVLELYECAKQNDYRFYSFGDAMFIC